MPADEPTNKPTIEDQSAQTSTEETKVAAETSASQAEANENPGVPAVAEAPPPKADDKPWKAGLQGLRKFSQRAADAAREKIEKHVTQENLDKAVELAKKHGSTAAKASLAAAQKGAAYTRDTAVELNKKRQESVERSRIAKAEAAAQQKVTAFRDVERQLNSLADFINPESIEKVRNYYKRVDGAPDALAYFTSHAEVAALVERATARQAFVREDRARQQPDATFTTTSGTLLRTLDKNTGDRITKNLTKKYTVRDNSPSVVGLVARKNYVGVASSMAQSSKTAYQNGRAMAAFTSDIFNIEYQLSASSISELHRAGLVTAHRMLYFRIGPEPKVQQCLFALAYNNGNAAPFPPSGPFSSVLHPEFHNNFMSYMMTAGNALAQLEEIKAANPNWSSLLEAKSLQPTMQTYVDTVPEPPSGV